MKCPSCTKEVNDNFEKCPDCGFHFELLKKKIKSIPRKSGWLIDKADIVDEDYTNLIFEYLINFSRETQIDFYVVTIPDCGDILTSEYVFYFLNHYNVGGEKHRGVVLLLSLKEKQIACEVGYSLEHILTDEYATEILERDVAPLLKKGEYGKALYSAVNLIGDLLKNGNSRMKRIIERILNVVYGRY